MAELYWLTNPFATTVGLSRPGNPGTFAGMGDTFKGNETRPWGRWLLAAAAMGVVALVAGYFLWTASLQRRLDQQVAALRAAGEPVEITDLTAPSVPDERNAVIDLRRAAATLNSASGGGQMQLLPETDFTLPLSADAAAQLRTSVQQNQSVLEDMARAVKKPGTDWQIKFTSPSVGILLPDLNYQRSLALFLSAAAIDAHLSGDDAAAVTRLRYGFFQADRVGHQPMLISHVVAAGVASSTAAAVENIAPDLRIGGSGGASPEQVRALIDDLLDEQAMREGLRRGLRGERVSQLDIVRCVSNGTVSYRTLTTVTAGGAGSAAPIAFEPFVLRDGLIMLEHTSAVLAAMDAPDQPSFNQAGPALPDWISGSNNLGHPVARLMLPGIHNAPQVLYRTLAERRLVATLLAIRWYALEHDGQRPETLEQLVPRYLPAVPLDPFLAGGKPIRYIPDGDTPSVYSVGTDGRDNNGSVGNSRWQGPDLVIPLDRATPTTQPDDAAMQF